MNAPANPSHPTKRGIVLSGAIVLGICAFVNLGCQGEKKQMRPVIQQAKPLIAAIEQFKAKRGVYPDNLLSLVPDFIAQIPKTGSSDFPKFKYSKDNSIAKFTGGYELRAPMPFTPDMGTGRALVYWPTGKYPLDPHGYGLGAVLFDGWAYYYADSSDVPPAKDFLQYPID